MMCDDFKSMVEVKPVRVVARRPAIEMDLIAVCHFRLFDHPFEKFSAMAILSRIGIGDQIIDVEHLAPRQKLQKSESYNGFDLLALLHIDQVIPFGYLPLYLCNESLNFCQMRTKLTDHVEARADLFSGDCFLDLWTFDCYLIIEQGRGSPLY